MCTRTYAYARGRSTPQLCRERQTPARHFKITAAARTQGVGWQHLASFSITPATTQVRYVQLTIARVNSIGLRILFKLHIARQSGPSRYWNRKEELKCGLSSYTRFGGTVPLTDGCGGSSGGGEGEAIRTTGAATTN